MITSIVKSKKKYINFNDKVRLFDPMNKKPRPGDEDPAFSEDVIIIDENGLKGLAFFAFEENKWVFYADTLVDYNAENTGIKWKWYYQPVLSKHI